MRQRSDRWFLQLSYAMVGLALVALAISSAAGVRRGRMARAPVTAQIAGDSGEAGGSEEQAQETVAGPDLAPSPVIVSEAEPDFFEEFRLERERERALEIEIMQEVAKDPDTDPGVRRQAQAALLAAVSRARREFDAESMVLARGYADAIVSVTDEGVSVVVKSGRLEEAGVRAIGDMVARATGVNLSRITIAERQD